jgi:6-pyruvoyltetrahydropterin/6-carboxytetrahydropterin synthase
MSFEVGVEGRFTASHHLVGEFGPARELHAHEYRVQISVSGDGLHGDGTLFDITRLQHAMADVIADIDGTNLNDLPDAQLAKPNPTAEVMARFFFDRVVPTLAGQGLARLEARVWESPEAFAGYSGDLA